MSGCSFACLIGRSVVVIVFVFAGGGTHKKPNRLRNRIRQTIDKEEPDRQTYSQHTD